MNVTSAENTWGTYSGHEVQRTDLWQIDLTTALRYFNSLSPNLYTALNLDIANLPTYDTVQFYASKIMLPVQKLATRRIIQGTIPRNMPAYFEAVDTVRVDFVHDTATQQSKIYTLLQIWRCITRIGRTGNEENKLLLPNCTFKPQFKFDVQIKLLAGADGTGAAMQDSAKYALVACWPRVVQQAALDSSQKAQLHTIAAQFQVQEIIS